MKNKNQAMSDVEKWVEEALQATDGMRRAEANPFLETRILERWKQNYRPWINAGSWLTRPALAISLLVLILFINFLVYSKVLRNQNQQIDQQATETIVWELTPNNPIFDDIITVK